MDLAKRIELERSVVARFIRDATAAGNVLRVWDGETFAGPESADSDVLLDQCFSADSDRIYIYPPPTEATGRYLGWVWFVYGNSPWEVLCDVYQQRNHLPAHSGLRRPDE